MSAPSGRLQPQRFAALPNPITAENKFWRSFKVPVVAKEYSAVSNIHFSAESPHDFAVTSGTRVQIYGASSRSVKKTIARFKDIAYSGNIRKDGKLLIAGDATGLVQIFDLSTRSILRSLNLHQFPVQVTKFCPYSQTSFLSGSDDKTVKVWDLATGEAHHDLQGHEDYVRAAEWLSATRLVSSGYDGTVRLWDTRLAQPEVMSFNHGDSVDAILPLQSGSTIVSAGGPYVKVWDLVAGKSTAAKTLTNHQKSVTCLGTNSDNTRLLSGGLDGHVKVYDVADWKVVHGIKYSAPILSLGLSPDDRNLVVGMTNGALSQRTRRVNKQPTTKTPFLLGVGSAFGVVQRKKDVYKGENDEFYVEEVRRKRLRPFDKALKTFNYGDALDSSLENGSPILVITMLIELLHVGGLRIALSNRDDLSLSPLLKFLRKYIQDPRFTDVLAIVANTVLDIYGIALGGSVMVESAISKFREKVEQEVVISQKANELVGMLHMLSA
ncbi:U3 snoRNP protein Utp15 [Schizosaccharomyces cryophilus OY26]|uniref:U3 snoRNP protein Utp15 n=1 Tax=Schizosaccharomyces cryophilus (strain OY26 / ATCC MYA-4695 / CBS 11777 / NBRC 106824 / NRRL Y48691) TaxID=653667 RepID=S9VX28_SCHCR|nr:U3 snoRNP protein Utp15 [Schizosaccharomyces cryophilus OY26]EPY50525.1 U3 snoRNP protein Utp15 [Schizosaccharomyces cryophilus OY26]